MSSVFPGVQGKARRGGIASYSDELQHCHAPQGTRRSWRSTLTHKVRSSKGVTLNPATPYLTFHSGQLPLLG